MRGGRRRELDDKSCMTTEPTTDYDASGDEEQRLVERAGFSEPSSPA